MPLGVLLVQVWRDAYSLYTLLAVVARLAGHQPPQPAAPALAPQHPQPSNQPQEPQEQQPAQHTQESAAVAAAGGTQQVQSGAADVQQLLSDALKQLDLAALMGGLRFRPWVDKLIDAVDAQLQSLQASGGRSDQEGILQPIGAGGKRKAADDVARGFAAPAAAGDGSGGGGAGAVAGIWLQEDSQGDTAAAGGDMVQAAGPPCKQLRLVLEQQDVRTGMPNSSAEGNPAAAAGGAGAAAAGGGPPDELPTGGVVESEEVTLPPGSLTAHTAVIPVEQAPSMEHFLVHYMLATGGVLATVAVLHLCGAVKHMGPAY